MRDLPRVPRANAPSPFYRMEKRAVRFAGVIGAMGVHGESPNGADTGDGASLLEWVLDEGGPSPLTISGCPRRHLRVSLVGTIDNARELARELEGRAHKFSKNTEAEIVAHAYEQWGEECVARLWGVFALAIWDGRRRTLLLARDRTGSKAVYYCRLPGAFVFGSHLSVLRRMARIPSEVDPQAIDSYLTFETVPAPLTIFRLIRKLPAGGLLRLEGGVLRVRAYWAIKFETGKRVDLPEAIERFDGLFLDVVGRLMGRSRCGLLLSGGIDSGITLATLARASPAPVQAFTFVFPGDNRSGQRAPNLATYFNANSLVFPIRPHPRDDLPEVVARYEQPYANPSALSAHYMASILRDRHETIFTGEGADEVFAGRERHIAAAMVGRLQRVPLRRLVSAIGTRVPVNRIRLFSEGLSLSPSERHIRWVGTFQDDMKAQLYSPEFMSFVEPTFVRSLVGSMAPTVTEPLDQMLSADFRVWIPENLWTNFEYNFSAGGIDIRAPFLDHRIVEFSACLPPPLKVNWLTSKLLLRRVYGARVPGPPPRQGGGRPKISMAALLRQELRSVVHDTLLTPRAMARGYFQPAAVRQLVDEHLSGRIDRSRQVWALLMLELWHRHWLT